MKTTEDIAEARLEKIILIAASSCVVAMVFLLLTGVR